MIPVTSREIERGVARLLAMADYRVRLRSERATGGDILCNAIDWSVVVEVKSINLSRAEGDEIFFGPTANLARHRKIASTECGSQGRVVVVAVAHDGHRIRGVGALGGVEFERKVSKIREVRSPVRIARPISVSEMDPLVSHFPKVVVEVGRVVLEKKLRGMSDESFQRWLDHTSAGVLMAKEVK